MIINAFVDRIENGIAVLLSSDMGIEISIPVPVGEGKFSEGDSVSLIIESDGSVKSVG
jgi:hypothetical protein